MRKKIEEVKKAQGILPKKVLEARKHRALTLSKKKKAVKGVVFNNDVWEDDKKGNNRFYILIKIRI